MSFFKQNLSALSFLVDQIWKPLWSDKERMDNAVFTETMRTHPEVKQAYNLSRMVLAVHRCETLCQPPVFLTPCKTLQTNIEESLQSEVRQTIIKACNSSASPIT